MDSRQAIATQLVCVHREVLLEAHVDLVAILLLEAELVPQNTENDYDEDNDDEDDYEDNTNVEGAVDLKG